jgi:V/A-type H+-transporting ATPase subunit D
MINQWLGLFAVEPIGLKPFLIPVKIITHLKNIAGIDIPVFDQVEFAAADYDLFIMPLWIDAAIEALRSLIILNQEILVVSQGIGLLRQELRITTQRVNLFEKVKIPEAEENIRLIKIYIGDQMANAVGRCKIAKRKIEELVLAGEAA